MSQGVKRESREIYDIPLDPGVHDSSAVDDAERELSRVVVVVAGLPDEESAVSFAH